MICDQAHNVKSPSAPKVEVALIDGFGDVEIWFSLCGVWGLLLQVRSAHS